MSRSKRVELLLSSALLWLGIMPEKAKVEMVKELLLDAETFSPLLLTAKQFQM